MAIETLSGIEKQGTGAFGAPGEIRQQCGSSIPAGWMVCEGQLLAVADYPLLFAAIEDTFGGNGTTNFALPNYRTAGSGARKIICIDSHASPTVLQVNVPAAIHGPIPGYYKAGDTLEFSVQLLEGIAVSGGPVALNLNVGGVIHALSLVSATATQWLFSYVIQAGDTGLVTAELDLNGATLITVADGHVAALSIGAVYGEIVADTTAPVVPTVKALSTAVTTPTLTGTATVASGESLTVVVNGVTYSSGDGHLSISGTVWTLAIPPANALATGTYPVVATVTDLAGNASIDTGTNELVITA